MAEERAPGFHTLAIHAGARPDPATGARATPIYQTTSYVFNDVEHAAALFGLKAFGNIYTRLGNPTQAVLEERVAALEGGTAALAVASGHAAQAIVFHTLCKPGDEIVAAKRLYGGSINQLGHSFKSFGWNVVWADTDDISTFEAAISPRTKAVFVESIANPGGIITDISAIAAIAHKAGVPLIVDNTLATPYLCRPFEHGADIVVHSLTKFMGGHGNSIGGVIVDGGTFNWSAEAGRYPLLSEPRPEYHGVKLHETFGNFAFAIACRVLGLARSRAGDLALQRVPVHHRHRDAAAPHAAPFRQRARRRQVAVKARRGDMGQLCRPARRPLSQPRQAIRAEGRGRGADLRPARRQRGGHRRSSRACSSSRTSPISATRAR